MYTSFKHVLLESTIEDTIRREFPGIPLQIKETSNTIQLIVFVVPYKERRKGVATEFINRLKELADQEGKDVILTPSDGYLTSDGDMNLTQLKSFYKKMGFVKNTGNSKFELIYKGHRW